jgi:hypothetical protein
VSPFFPSRAQRLNRERRAAQQEQEWTKERVWGTSAMEIRAALQTAAPDLVRLIDSAEKEHPRYPGGRSTVLSATAERSAVLETPNSQEA